MKPGRFLAVVRELVDENPFAIRAVLKILDVVFTEEVPTLAVTCEVRPRLLVNLSFVRTHCRTDAHVKAVLCHEFLHVLLRHTDIRGPFTRARHIAFDAVINAIIAREHGETYSSLFSRYYAGATGIERLLRPMTQAEQDRLLGSSSPPAWVQAWRALYAGLLVADDIEELARDLDGEERSGGQFLTGPGDGLLGDHRNLGGELPELLTAALGEALKELNGSGIWRKPHGRGTSAQAAEALIAAANAPLRRWEATTLAVLRRHFSPGSRSEEFEVQSRDYVAPVLSPGDRRAFLRTLWDPILPQAIWAGTEQRPRPASQVYLDVSGSMNLEMPSLIALLGRLSRSIRRPFWAFSDQVAAAVIENGALRTSTTGGTSMACVLDHIAKTQPAAAVVFTDGYIERLDPQTVQARLGRTRLHAIITRNGSPAQLRAAGIPYTQLEAIPQ